MLEEFWGKGSKNITGLRDYFRRIGIVINEEDLVETHKMLDMNRTGCVQYKEVRCFLLSTKLYDRVYK
jgi:hypothetical protein